MTLVRRRLSALIDLGGRLAIVTGAGQGFGYAIAARLADAGASVVVADRDVDRAQLSAARIGNTQGKAIAARVDVSEPESVEALFASLPGPADIVVNNAGVFSNYLAHQMPPEEFARIMQVNVNGTFYVSRAFVRAALAAGRSGTIINIASVDAFRGSAEGLAHYTASKHAIAGLTRSMAMEFAPRGIRVNAICPGASMTEGATALVTEGAPEGIDVAAQWDGIVERTPMGRLCDPDDVGRAAVFLASDLAEFITGVLLPVDGGILVQPLEGYVSTTKELHELP
ncbi:MAG TPA: SDR family oxidoreductase [Acidimicrobiia bacterium]|nr:SDR family oxidoreductase [Acidimicrobiia bacterium]